MGYYQYFQRAAAFLDLVAGQRDAKTRSNLSRDGGDGTGLAMIIGNDIG